MVAMASESRIAPSMTMPATPFFSAMVAMISPMMALVSSPPASTTTTSPGPAMSMALWTRRLSPGRVLTVSAKPSIGVPSCIGLSAGPAANHVAHERIDLALPAPR
jgi:hypothetical protein